MIEFKEFKDIYLKNVYSYSIIVDSIINDLYEDFKEFVGIAENDAITMLKSDGIDISQQMFHDALDEEHYKVIINKSVLDYLDDIYEDETLKDSGICLVKNLVGRACQMRHDEDLVGIVKGFDEVKRNLLIIDFGDKDNLKVDVDELRIVGQVK